MVFAVTIKPPPLPRGLRNVRSIIEQEQRRTVSLMALRLKKEMVDASLAVKSLGTMANSWQVDPAPARIVGNLAISGVKAAGAGGVEALVWEKGTRSGRHPRPPTRPGSPLRRWVAAKLGITARAENRRVAFAIARSIKFGGLKRGKGLPNPSNPGNRRRGLFTRAQKRALPDLRMFGKQMRGRIIRRLGGR